MSTFFLDVTPCTIRVPDLEAMLKTDAKAVGENQVVGQERVFNATQGTNRIRGLGDSLYPRIL
jgi:hypothetical protein